jgi:hypothetical protein
MQIAAAIGQEQTLPKPAPKVSAAPTEPAAAASQVAPTDTPPAEETTGISSTTVWIGVGVAALLAAAAGGGGGSSSTQH